jgi:hypothetical protein
VTPLAPKSDVTLNGYGCLGFTEPNPDGKLRFADYKTSPMSSLAQYKFTATEIATEEANYSLTVLTLANAPEVCPGDSGGPLYRKGTSVIVGINSTGVPKGKQGPAFDWFTRVDGKARYGVAAWLQSLGVQTTAGCAAASCVAVADE